jgi:hypothetical protein
MKSRALFQLLVVGGALLGGVSSCAGPDQGGATGPSNQTPAQTASGSDGGTGGGVDTGGTSGAAGGGVHGW